MIGASTFGTGYQLLNGRLRTASNRLANPGPTQDELA
jgi:hypothetical protein